MFTQSDLSFVQIKPILGVIFTSGKKKLTRKTLEFGQSKDDSVFARPFGLGGVLYNGAGLSLRSAKVGRSVKGGATSITYAGHVKY